MARDLYLVVERRFRERWVGVKLFGGVFATEQGVHKAAVEQRNDERFDKLDAAAERAKELPRSGPWEGYSDLTELTTDICNNVLVGVLPADDFARIVLETDAAANAAARRDPAGWYLGINRDDNENLANWRVVFWYSY